MSVQISVKDNLDDVTRQLSLLQKRRIPEVAKGALNQVGFGSRGFMKKVMQQDLHKPVKRTWNATLYRKATERDLSVEVYINDDPKSGVAPNRYLEAQIEGGKRRSKGTEKALRSVGILGNSQYVIVNPKYQNEAGNITKGVTIKMLSQLGAAEMTAGYTANQSRKSKARAGSARKQHFPLYRDGRAIGIFVRKNKSTIENVLGFKQGAPSYDQGLDFYGKLERYMLNKFRVEIRRLVRKVLMAER